MIYRIMLTLLFFTISISNYVFSEELNLSSSTSIPVILENDISPNSSIRAKIVLVVEEDVKNSSNTLLIPRYTRIMCQQNETKRLEKVDAIFASCQQMFLPNGKVINFVGNIFDKAHKGSITTEKNKSIPKGTHLLVKPEGSISINLD